VPPEAAIWKGLCSNLSPAQADEILRRFAPEAQSVFLSPLLGGEGGRVCRAADATQPAGWGRGNLVVDAAANGADCWSNGAEPATTTLSEAV
jgi:hypothetical protein